MATLIQSPDYNEREITDHFFHFLYTVNQVLRRSLALSARPGDSPNEWSGILNELIDYIFNTLSERTVYSTIPELISALDDDDRAAAQLLAHEMHFYEIRYAPVIQNANAYTAATGLDDARTIVSSTQRLIDKLPKWLQKILEVLSEALGLAKSVLPLL